MTDTPYGGEPTGSNIPPEIARELELSRGIDPERLAEIPERVLRRLMRRLLYADLAHARQNFRRNQRRDENGIVPENAMMKALAQQDAMRLRVQRDKVAGLPARAGAVSPGMLAATAGLTGGPTWQSLGPKNIGGRTRAVVPHPTDPNIIWTASAGGGIWRSDDEGASWHPLDDRMANLAVTCLAIDPNDSEILYAGTGEGFGNVDAIRGAGIFTTTNGTDWDVIAATSGFHTVNRIAVSSDGAVLLAASRDGIYRCADTARATWTLVSSMPMSTVLFHPTDSNLAVAGALNNEAFYSTDGGQNWRPAAHAFPWEGRIELAYAAADPSILYASVASEGGQIWRSVDGGVSYDFRGPTKNGQPIFYLGDQGWYNNVIWAGDPNDENLVLVGGIDLWRSLDGGATANDISTWYDDRSAHADHHCIASSDPAARVVYFGNDGGIYRTRDVRTVGDDLHLPRIHGWENLNNDYAVTQFYDAAVSTDGVIIGGAQDNGTLRYDTAAGTREWTTMEGGDGGYCAADPNDPNVFYGQYVFLSIHRSDDAGLSADYVSGSFYNRVTERWEWKPAPYTIPDAQFQRALFIAPFVLDPNDTNVILAGGRSLWRTSNARAPITDATGPAWSRVKVAVGARISALAIAPSDSGQVWVGYEDGQLFRTSNASSATPTWRRVGLGATALPLRFVTAIVVDRTDPDTVYATYDGFRRDNVWRTTNGGKTWTNIGATLPEVPVRALTVHPNNRTRLYVGTEVGVFASEDGAVTWSPTNEGPTNCPVDALIFFNTTLVSATHGRGMFSIDLSAIPAVP